MRNQDACAGGLVALMVRVAQVSQQIGEVDDDNGLSTQLSLAVDGVLERVDLELRRAWLDVTRIESIIKSLPPPPPPDGYIPE